MTVLAVPDRQLMADRGEVARWRHTATLPCLEVALFATGIFGGYPAQQAHACVGIAPVGSAGPIRGVTDPAELRAMAWTLLDAARWLERQREPTQPVYDPQTTIYDHLEAAR